MTLSAVEQVKIDLSGQYINLKGAEYSRGDLSIYMLSRRQRGRTPQTYLLLKESRQYISSLYKVPESTQKYLIDYQGVPYLLEMTASGFEITKRAEL